MPSSECEFRGLLLDPTNVLAISRHEIRAAFHHSFTNSTCRLLRALRYRCPMGFKLTPAVPTGSIWPMTSLHETIFPEDAGSEFGRLRARRKPSLSSRHGNRGPMGVLHSASSPKRHPDYDPSTESSLFAEECGGRLPAASVRPRESLAILGRLKDRDRLGAQPHGSALRGIHAVIGLESEAAKIVSSRGPKDRFPREAYAFLEKTRQTCWQTFSRIVQFEAVARFETTCQVEALRNALPGVAANSNPSG